MVKRIFVEKKEGFDPQKDKLIADIKGVLGIEVKSLRKLIRYDIEGLEGEMFKKAAVSIFSEPPLDNIYYELVDVESSQIIVIEYLDGQFDQRADSAMQCVQLLTGGIRPLIRCADVYIFDEVSLDEIQKIKKYIINPVDSKEGNIDIPKTLKRSFDLKNRMRVELEGFTEYSESELKKFYDSFGFAMTWDDFKFVCNYFKSEMRNPTLTEIKVIDTYWSDHCRHTTFLTEIRSIKILSNNPHIKNTLRQYRDLFGELYAKRSDKYPCLMDLATIAVKKLKKEGYLDNIDISDEINACSVVVDVDVNGVPEEWLIMFKNETHNHPTEIEPFGGAATCLGGAIRDPLSGRTYVYQAMRVTGAGNPLEDYSQTLKGKLPQRVLTKTALSGFSSYGNQIGLATGMVHEFYNDRYKAKRLETGYVIGGAPKKNVVREKPQKGDIVLLLGGDTGRDGCGGATGSSKAHNMQSVEECGAEVQKGNAPEERKLQRLFRNAVAAKCIIKCNDFGAGGVSVAIGELSDGIDIWLDKINKKYDGLSATELAISESQERMAVVVKPENAKIFEELACAENLKCKAVGVITDSERLRMYYGEETVVDIKRSFLDTNGVKQRTDVVIKDEYKDYFNKIDNKTDDLVKKGKSDEALLYELSKLNCCSQKGAGEVFDSTIGAATVLMPFGGYNQITPALVAAAKPPVSGFTHTVTCNSFALYPELMIHSPYIGSIYSIIGAVSKLVVSGVEYSTIRLTLQEFFKKLGQNPERWGEPCSALLGAFDAECGLKLGAIGGKDSMSGSFENIDVPPTVIAFAMGVTRDDRIIHNVFGAKGVLYRYAVPKDSFGYPDYTKLLKIYTEIEDKIKCGIIVNSAVVEEGGLLVSITKSLLGNGIGAELMVSGEDGFKPCYGDIIAVSQTSINSEYAEYIGKLDNIESIRGKDFEVPLNVAIKAYTSTLEPIFPTTAAASGAVEESNYINDIPFKPLIKYAKPRVFIPVFPGTNCEYDTAKAFERAGAVADIFVVNNQTPESIEESIVQMKKRIDNAQIIAFPGGFSGGDEPDGSGKFIATAFKNPVLMDCVEKLLYTRDGLVIGICNGFQALIKLGLLPYGRIGLQNTNSPTLTYNNIARHVSTLVRVRVGTDKSPWLNMINTGEVYSVPVSHGEGKFVCKAEEFETLINNGQILTQYVDQYNRVTMLSPFNPNGSAYAIEGLISPDGRVLGKMGHAERWQKGLYQNVAGNFDMPLFEGGVKYFN